MGLLNQSEFSNYIYNFFSLSIYFKLGAIKTDFVFSNFSKKIMFKGNISDHYCTIFGKIYNIIDIFISFVYF